MVNLEIYPHNDGLDWNNGALAMSYSIAELIRKRTYNHPTDHDITTDFTFPNAMESSNVYGWMDENCVFMKYRSNVASDLNTGIVTFEPLTAGAGNLRVMWSTIHPTNGYYDNTQTFDYGTYQNYNAEVTGSNIWYRSDTTPIGISQYFVPVIRLKYSEVILYCVFNLYALDMSTGGVSSVYRTKAQVDAGYVTDSTLLTDEELEELKTTGRVVHGNSIWTLGGIAITPFYGNSTRSAFSFAFSLETNMDGVAWFGTPCEVSTAGGTNGTAPLTYYNSSWIGGNDLYNVSYSSGSPEFSSLSVLNWSENFSFGVQDSCTVDMLNGIEPSAYNQLYTDSMVFIKYPGLNATCIAPFYTYDDIMNMIASFGLYFCFDASLVNESLGQSLTNSNIYLGKMYDNGRCDGTYTQGTATKTEPQAQDGMYIVSYLETDTTMEVEPLDPDQPYVPPEPENDDNTESGDKIPNQFDRRVGVTSNFITNYLMTEGQIAKLGEILWTSWADGSLSLDMIKNFYGNMLPETGSFNVSSVLQFITSCRLFPCSLATLVSTTSVTNIAIGTGSFPISCGTQTEPSFFIANDTVAVRNCGDVYIPREYNDYRDFENTTITATLPFCGTVELIPQDVVGKYVGCYYVIDLISGACKAFLFTKSNSADNYDNAYYNVAIKDGMCGFSIPISATQAGEVASRFIVDTASQAGKMWNSATSILGSLANLGVSIAQVSGAGGLASGAGSGSVVNSQGLITASGLSGMLGDAINIPKNIVGQGIQSVNAAGQALGRAGIGAPLMPGGSGFADFMQPPAPYVQVRRSYYQTPIEYENTIGYPTNAERYGNLSQFSGFVVCKNVDVSNLSCDKNEKAEIKSLLESGVYI